MLAQILPHGAPEDLLLVASPPLLREVQTNLVQKFGYSVQEAAHRRFSLATYAAVQVPDFDPNTIDRLAPSRKDDLVVHTALEGRADLLITNDKGLLVKGEWTEYSRLDGRSTRAVSLEQFASTLETSTFSLGEVPDALSVRVEDRVPPPLEE
jgi:predicted nucleic acid-binding protein